MEVLRVDELHAAYDVQAPVLRGVSLSIAAGEHLGLSGVSGAGKTTLLRLLSGLARQESSLKTSGTVRLFGEHDPLVDALPASPIGWVTEDPKAGLHPQRTIAQTWARLGVPATADSWLTKMGLSKPAVLTARYPHQLSGGEAQRIRIAMALSGSPKLLFLESPTAPLDSHTASLVLEVLDRYVAEGNAILHVTHDAQLLDRVASRRVHLLQGKLVAVPPAVRLLLRRSKDSPKPVLAKAETCVQVNSLSIAFAPDETPFVEHFALTLHKGETCGLAGKSGSGKTSIGLALARLIPATGHIEFCGSGRKYPLATHTLSEPDTRVQYLFQEPRSALNPRLSVEQTLEDALHSTSAPKGLTVDKLLDQVALARELKPRAAISLSTGQMLRLTLARALAVAPQVLVCDEIFANVDGETRQSLLTSLRSIQRASGLAIIWIGHDLQQLAAVCDRVVVIDQGRSVDVLVPPLAATEDSHPATKQLLRAAGLV